MTRDEMPTVGTRVLVPYPTMDQQGNSFYGHRAGYVTQWEVKRDTQRVFSVVGTGAMLLGKEYCRVFTCWDSSLEGPGAWFDYEEIIFKLHQERLI